MRQTLTSLALVSLFGLSACGGDDSTGGAPARATSVARFSLAERGPLAFLDLPFPSDLYLDESGHADIASPAESTPALDLAFALLRERRGFCRGCSITFPIEGALEPESLPGDAGPDSVASLDDAIVLTRADGTGEPVPLEVDYDTVDSQIVVRPRYGVILEPATEYVAVLTDAIRAADGTALGPDDAFRRARDGGGDAAARRARAVIAPALDALARAGLSRKRVVSAAVFTTDDERFMLEAIAREVAAAPAPKLTVERVIAEAGGGLDELLGKPSEARPGTDNPPSDGVGTESIVHDAIAFVVLGTFQTLRIVSGAGTEIGTPRRSSDGSFDAGPTPETVPYVLVVPKSADLAHLPVVFAHPGFPSTKAIALHVGNTFAKLGMATLSIDPFQMGHRATSAKDEQLDFRGMPGADGFYEHSDTSVELHVLAQAGAAPGHQGDLAYVLGFLSQMTSDAAMSVKLIREGDTSAVGAAEPGLAGFAFDPSKLFYLGQSFGASMGMMTLPILPAVNAAILSVGPPDMIENSCNGPGNRPGFELITVNQLGLSRPFEEAGRRLAMNPRMNLVSWATEPLAPKNTLRYLFDHRLDDAPPPDVLFFYAEHDELLGQTSGEEIMGIAGVPVHGPTMLANVAPLTAPLSANRQTPTGAVTAGVWIHDSNHSLIRQKHVELDYETPFFPPFERLASPLAHENPIEQAHAQMSAFFATRLASGRAQIIDPAAP